jgi:acyl-CoA thioester hydrolase
MHRFYEQVFGVYFDDLDPFEILHNARYLFLFERALGAFWMEIGWGAFQDEDHPEQFHLVARNEVDYVEPVRGVGRVRVRVWVERIGTSSLTFAFTMMPMDRDAAHARCRRTIVHVDRGTLAARPWSDEFREKLLPWTESTS